MPLRHWWCYSYSVADASPVGDPAQLGDRQTGTPSGQKHPGIDFIVFDKRWGGPIGNYTRLLKVDTLMCKCWYAPKPTNQSWFLPHLPVWPTATGRLKAVPPWHIIWYKIPWCHFKQVHQYDRGVTMGTRGRATGTMTRISIKDVMESKDFNTKTCIIQYRPILCLYI